MKTLVNCPCARWHKEAGWVGNPDCFLGCGGTGTLTFVEPDPSPCSCPASIYMEGKPHSVACPLNLEAEADSPPPGDPAVVPPDSRSEGSPILSLE